MMPVRLEPTAPRSRVKHSTTEPLRSQINKFLSLTDLSGTLNLATLQGTFATHILLIFPLFLDVDEEVYNYSVEYQLNPTDSRQCSKNRKIPEVNEINYLH